MTLVRALLGYLRLLYAVLILASFTRLVDVTKSIKGRVRSFLQGLFYYFHASQRDHCASSLKVDTQRRTEANILLK